MPALLPGGRLVTAETVGDLPPLGGAYALLLTLPSPVQLQRPAPALLPPGNYVYAGSANGPGGLRGRLGVHFRAHKPHWHIDRLTAAATGLSAIALEGGSECAIVARLEALPGFAHPLPGFGSSDCPRCRSHLLCYS